MGEETKARGTTHARGGTATTKKREKKKGVEMAPHVQRVFGASSGAVGELLFSAPSVSLARPPVPVFSTLVSRGPYILRFLSFSPSGILARSAPSRGPSFPPRLFLFLYSSFLFPFTLQAHPARTREPSISSPAVSPRYPEEEKKIKRKKSGRKRGKKASGAPARPNEM